MEEVLLIPRPSQDALDVGGCLSNNGVGAALGSFEWIGCRIVGEHAAHAPSGALGLGLIVGVTCYLIQLRQHRVGICLHKSESEDGVNPADVIFGGPETNEAWDKSKVLAAKMLEGLPPCGGSIASPINQIREGVGAHVKQGVCLLCGILCGESVDPLAKSAALVGGFPVLIDDGEEQQSAESSAEQEGEFLPISPHEGSVARRGKCKKRNRRRGTHSLHASLGGGFGVDEHDRPARFRSHFRVHERVFRQAEEMGDCWFRQRPQLS
jgi:hypothetical protein